MAYSFLWLAASKRMSTFLIVVDCYATGVVNRMLDYLQDKNKSAFWLYVYNIKNIPQWLLLYYGNISPFVPDSIKVHFWEISLNLQTNGEETNMFQILANCSACMVHNTPH